MADPNGNANGVHHLLPWQLPSSMTCDDVADLAAQSASDHVDALSPAELAQQVVDLAAQSARKVAACGWGNAIAAAARGRVLLRLPVGWTRRFEPHWACAAGYLYYAPGDSWHVLERPDGTRVEPSIVATAQSGVVMTSQMDVWPDDIAHVQRAARHDARWLAQWEGTHPAHVCGEPWEAVPLRDSLRAVALETKAQTRMIAAAADAIAQGSHLIDGEFQSDKYPTCPRGKVPLSVKDPSAQDLLWEYAQRRRPVDAQFSADLEAALRLAGYDPAVGRADASREFQELVLLVGRATADRARRARPRLEGLEEGLAAGLAAGIARGLGGQ